MAEVHRARPRAVTVTVPGYKVMVRSMLLPAFGELQLEAITSPMIERWVGSLDQSASTRTNAIVLMHSIFARAKRWGSSFESVARLRR